MILKGESFRSSNTMPKTAVGQVSKRILNIGTDIVQIASFASADGMGRFKQSDFKYARITNLDDSNFIAVDLRKAGAHSVVFKLEAGQSMFLNNLSFFVDDDGTFSATPAGLTFNVMDEVYAEADTAAVDIEFVVWTA
jgi:hypothetical protein